MENNKIVKILQDFWPRNKAKGLLAQSILANEIKENVFGKNGNDKFLPGCWLLAPKSLDFYKFRFSFFIHQSVVAKKEIESANCEKFLVLIFAGKFFFNFHRKDKSLGHTHQKRIDIIRIVERLFKNTLNKTNIKKFI